MSILSIIVIIILLFLCAILAWFIWEISTYEFKEAFVIDHLQKHGTCNIKDLRKASTIFQRPDYGTLHLMEDDGLIMSKKLEDGTRIYKINNGEGW